MKNFYNPILIIFTVLIATIPIQAQTSGYEYVDMNRHVNVIDLGVNSKNFKYIDSRDASWLNYQFGVTVSYEFILEFPTDLIVHHFASLHGGTRIALQENTPPYSFYFDYQGCWDYLEGAGGDYGWSKYYPGFISEDPYFPGIPFKYSEVNPFHAFAAVTLPPGEYTLIAAGFKVMNLSPYNGPICTTIYGFAHDDAGRGYTSANPFEVDFGLGNYTVSVPGTYYENIFPHDNRTAIWFSMEDPKLNQSRIKISGMTAGGASLDIFDRELKRIGTRAMSLDADGCYTTDTDPIFHDMVYLRINGTLDPATEVKISFVNDKVRGGFEYPYSFGIIESGMRISDSRDMELYGSVHGRGNPDVVYGFEIQQTLKLIATTEGSDHPNSLLYVLDENRLPVNYPQTKINPDGSVTVTINRIEPGKYYLVSESGADNGELRTTIEGRSLSDATQEDGPEPEPDPDKEIWSEPGNNNPVQFRYDGSGNRINRIILSLF